MPKPASGVFVCVCVCVTYKGEVWCILAQQSGEDSLSLDALLVLEHIAVHETIQHGGVGMNINVELQTNSLMEEKREKGSEREQRERDTERQKIKKTQQVSGEDGDIFLTVQQHTPVYPLRLREGLSLLCWGEAVTRGANTNPPDHHGREYVYHLNGANHPHITSIRLSL